LVFKETTKIRYYIQTQDRFKNLYHKNRQKSKMITSLPIKNEYISAKIISKRKCIKKQKTN